MAETAQTRTDSVAGTLVTALLTGLVLFLVGSGFHLAVPYCCPPVQTEYADRDLFRAWEGWTPIYMAVHPFWYGPVLTLAYVCVHRGGVFGGFLGGVRFGLLIFLAGHLPVYALNFASFQVSFVVVAPWAVQALVQLVTAGALLGAAFQRSAVVQVSTRLPLPPDRAWRLIEKKATFLHITRGLVGFPGADAWPERLLVEGQTIRTTIRIFGVLPPVGHNLHVCRADPVALEAESREHGGFVRVWKHWIKVEPDPQGRPGECRYTDRIEIEAGWLTAGVAAFAHVFYRYRQRRLRRLAASGAGEMGTDTTGVS